MKTKFAKNAVSLQATNTFVEVLCGLSVANIAERDNISVQAVYQRLRIARESMDLSEVQSMLESDIFVLNRKAVDRLNAILDLELTNDKGQITGATVVLGAAKEVLIMTVGQLQKLQLADIRAKAQLEQLNTPIGDPIRLLESLTEGVGRLNRFVDQAKQEVKQADMEVVGDDRHNTINSTGDVVLCGDSAGQADCQDEQEQGIDKDSPEPESKDMDTDQATSTRNNDQKLLGEGIGPVGGSTEGGTP